MSNILLYVTSEGDMKEIKYNPNKSTVDLSNLDIHHFDTSQLLSNDRLRNLYLNENNIERLDITPLLSCKKLDTLILDDETDAETILSFETMEDIAKEVIIDAAETFDALTYLPSLRSISASFEYVRKYEPEWKMIHLFQNSLRIIGCGWMGMVDLKSKERKNILKKLSISGNTKEIHDTLISHLIEGIRNKQPTIDLDIDSMKNYGDLVLLIDDLVEQRIEEMKNLFVPVLKFGIDQEGIALLESVGESVDTHYADLRMLWLSSYGYEVLESLSLGTTCEMREFSKIQKAFLSIGYEIKTKPDTNTYSIIGWRNRKFMRKFGVKSPEPIIELPKHLSNDMIEYIWQLAEFRTDSPMTIVASSFDKPFKIELG